MRKIWTLGPLAAGLMLAGSIQAELAIETSGIAALEQRYFFEQPLYFEQTRGATSAFIEPEIYMEWGQGDDSLIFKPFLRVDQQDSERTHGDIRELMWLHVGDEWELRTGIGKVFWGQTESQHLVDIINQTDFVETIDTEDKLGQPMVNLSFIKDWGTTSFFVLPYFRERLFPGLDGRFRFPVDLLQDDPLYESDDEESNIDYAARYQHYIGAWEIGLSYFDGTSREPMFLFEAGETGPVLRPFYPQMQQVGVDLLAAYGSWLWKFEGIQRDFSFQPVSNALFEFEDYFATTVGFEYTFVGVWDTSYDVGILLEHQYDEREERATTPGQNDLMLGSRFVLNDINGTEILIGYVQDLDRSDSRSAFIESSSRIDDHWKWRVEGYFFSADDPEDINFFFRRDDYVQFSLEYYF